ncbi:hypothetical protein CLU89_3209 [Acidovorax sp. 30]|jgi:hypothetical protein|nr:hypothetical protein CLU87_1354 [Acidovorax sp. 59]PKW03547.1 hypothetical protein CLU89_3209 [Acidovorax sp. 30]
MDRGFNASRTYMMGSRPIIISASRRAPAVWSATPTVAPPRPHLSLLRAPHMPLSNRWCAASRAQPVCLFPSGVLS